MSSPTSTSTTSSTDTTPRMHRAHAVAVALLVRWILGDIDQGRRAREAAVMLAEATWRTLNGQGGLNADAVLARWPDDAGSSAAEALAVLRDRLQPGDGPHNRAIATVTLELVRLRGLLADRAAMVADIVEREVARRLDRRGVDADLAAIAADAGRTAEEFAAAGGDR